ncbi:MAG: phosphatase PAP2 family protein [Bacteroidales bacterium]|nr:phosphatase PAP2 family protein [Bacteroidales bacterium]
MKRVKLQLLVSLFVCLQMVTPVVAQTDSSNVKHNLTKEKYQFSAKRVILPVSLGVVGATGLIPNSPLNKLSNSVHEEISVHSYHTNVDDWLQYMPLTMYMGLNWAYLHNGQHTIKESVSKTAIACLSTMIISTGLKYSIREKRPDSNKQNSFPSGHTAVVFTGAELVRLEYGNVYGSIAYSMALLVGSMRIYNDRHWIHDVVSGAGIGILSARIGNWLCPDFKKSERRKSVSCTPYFSVEKDGYLLSASVQF